MNKNTEYQLQQLQLGFKDAFNYAKNLLTLEQSKKISKTVLSLSAILVLTVGTTANAKKDKQTQQINQTQQIEKKINNSTNISNNPFIFSETAEEFIEKNFKELYKSTIKNISQKGYDHKNGNLEDKRIAEIEKYLFLLENIFVNQQTIEIDINSNNNNGNIFTLNKNQSLKHKDGTYNQIEYLKKKNDDIKDNENSLNIESHENSFLNTFLENILDIKNKDLFEKIKYFSPIFINNFTPQEIKKIKEQLIVQKTDLEKRNLITELYIINTKRNIALLDLKDKDREFIFTIIGLKNILDLNIEEIKAINDKLLILISKSKQIKIEEEKSMLDNIANFSLKSKYAGQIKK
jgi:hypothetical protein